MSNQSVIALAYDKRGRLLAVGSNSYIKTHPLQAHYSKVVGKPEKIYLHAEIDALIKAPRRPYKLVIVRRGRDGSLLASKPCKVCMRALNDYGVEVLVYTEPNALHKEYYDAGLSKN